MSKDKVSEVYESKVELGTLNSNSSILLSLVIQGEGTIGDKIPGDQEGLFKLAIQLRKFLFITL
jgi:hypothetical protein